MRVIVPSSEDIDMAFVVVVCRACYTGDDGEVLSCDDAEKWT